MRSWFLQTAAVVVDAVGDPAVAASWAEPSVLEDQTIGSLAAHLVGSGLGIVELALAEPCEATEPDFDSAVGYYVSVMASLDDAGHQAGRDRSAVAAAVGPADLTSAAVDQLARLELAVRDVDGRRLVSVPRRGVIALDDFLGTRLVEQVVHLDDLARSLGRNPWTVPDQVEACVVSIGAEVGRERFGATGMIRALYRGQGEGALPVL